MLKNFVAVSRAAGDVSRAKILKLLHAAPDGITVQNLTRAMKLSQPVISHHLRELLMAGLVSYRKEKMTHVYKLSCANAEAKAFCEAMLPLI